MKTVFVSDKSFEDAAYKARVSGFTITGMARNKKGQFVIFAVKQQVRW